MTDSPAEYGTPIDKFVMLVELSGQSASMSKQILRGFVRLSSLLRTWLEEADQKDILQTDLDFKEIANYIIIPLNGAAALYMSSRDRTILAAG